MNVYLMSTQNEQGMESAVVVVAKNIKEAEEKNGPCKRLKVMEWTPILTEPGDTWFLIETEIALDSNIIYLVSGTTMDAAASKIESTGIIKGIDTLEFKVLL